MYTHSGGDIEGPSAHVPETYSAHAFALVCFDTKFHQWKDCRDIELLHEKTRYSSAIRDSKISPPYSVTLHEGNFGSQRQVTGD